MEILQVTPELAPHARVSETADSVASLSKALRQMGHGVTVVLPRYPAFEEAGLLVARRLTPVELPGGEGVTAFDGQLSSGVKLVLLDSPGLLDRPGIYGENGTEYPDNARRFGLFARAAVGIIRERERGGAAFDVVHLHDWPAALVPIVFRAVPGAVSPCVLTIHDVTRQGSFPLESLDDLGVPMAMRGSDGVLLGDAVNVLKGAVLHSDSVTTVSPTYALQMRTRRLAGELADTLIARVDGIAGIVDGVDYAVVNPATDAAIASRYDAEDAAAKGSCKTAVVRALGLDIDTRRPLVAMPGQLTAERGFDVIADALPTLLRQDVTVVVAGFGSGELADRLVDASRGHDEHFALVTDPDDASMRRIFAGADIVLSSPRDEPSGSAQLVAQRYGAVPVAHATGGLRDTIVDCDARLETGTGFLFDEPSADSLLGAVRRALAAYGSDAWTRLRRRVMRLDVGWDRPARRYLQVYRDALSPS